MLDRYPSRRSTTSSRLPGKAIEGTVWVLKTKLVRCADCGRLWLGGEHHAMHWRQGVLVNCVGKTIERSK